MDKEFHSENRRKVAAHMAENEAMLFFSGEPCENLSAGIPATIEEIESLMASRPG